MSTDLVEQAYHKTLETWRNQRLTAREQFASALQEFRIRQAYHSGYIENEHITYHDTRDVFEEGRAIGFTGDVRTLFEIQNLKECHELMLDCLAHREALTKNLLLEFHRTLTQGTYDERRWMRGERPGLFKRHDYVVGTQDQGLPAPEVPEAVESLLDELVAMNESNALLVGTYFHLSLEAIHPFADGNGRCGRALLNYLLMLHNHPPIIIFAEDRLAYYGALNVWDDEADLEPMLSLLKVECVKTWQSGLTR